MSSLLLASFTPPTVQYSAIAPELFLAGTALFILLLVALRSKKAIPGIYSLITILGSVGSMIASFLLWPSVVSKSYFALDGAISVDGFSIFFFVAIAIAMVLSAALIDSFLKREGIEFPELYVLMLLSATGADLMAAGNDLIVIFLGLEILSLPLYVLAATNAKKLGSTEAAMKYFILGAFSSALFLYGIALTYGATGSTNLTVIASFLSSNLVPNDGLLAAGITLLLVGFGFKISLVPFHFWTPDVYQGSPSPITGFMASVAKIGGFAALLRVFMTSFSVMQLDWQPIVALLAVITLLVGAVLTIVQKDVKRMLAYSSISHAGFILLGLEAASGKGVASSLFYLFTYSIMVIGSFAVVTLVANKGDKRHDLENYRGLSSSRPILAFSFAILLLAQAGVPFTTGFFAKFYVLTAQVNAHSYLLAIIAMISAVITAFFYLRLALVMFSPIPLSSPNRIKTAIPPGAGIVIGITVAFTIIFGILPEPIINFATHAKLLF